MTTHATDLSSFAGGVAAAIQSRVPQLAEIPVAAGLSGGTERDELLHADAFAGALCDALDDRLPHDVVLVLDDVHELASAASARFLESLCRQAPATLHLVLASRAEPPFAVDRLRGQGQVLELTAEALAFDPTEIEALLGDAELAAALYELTGGWPALVRLAVATLAGVPPAARPEAFEQLRGGGDAMFAYLAREVFERESPDVRQLLRTAALLDRFTPELCEALGVRRAGKTLTELDTTGILRPAPGRLRTRSTALIRDFALRTWPWPPEDAHAVLRRAADWLESQGEVEAALSTLAAANAEPELARLLTEHGAQAARRRRDRDASPGWPRACPLRGPLRSSNSPARPTPHRASTIAHSSASPGLSRTPSRSPHRLRGGWCKRTTSVTTSTRRWRSTLGATRRAVPTRTTRCSWRGRRVLASAGERWRRHAPSRTTPCLRPRRQRMTARSPRPTRPRPWSRRSTATSWSVTSISRGRSTRRNGQTTSSRSSAFGTTGPRTCWSKGATRRRSLNWTSATAVAELVGFAGLRALALMNRGLAYWCLGRLEEASADYEAAISIYRQTGTREVCYAIIGRGDVHRERGNLAMARAAYEEGLQLAERSGDVQGLVPGLYQLAKVLVDEEPDSARAFADRAVSYGWPDLPWALNAAGWVALAHGDLGRAAGLAGEASAAAREQRDRFGLAESLELTALCAADPAEQALLLEEALAIWRGLGNQLHEAEVELALARLSSGPAAQSAADRAEGRLRALGVRVSPSGPAALLRFVAPQTGTAVTVETLGGFRVRRYGTPIRHEEWRSKKARDLLKILLARRGHPTSRDYVMDALWPEEDPVKVRNRLSVALSTLRGVLDPDKRFDPDQFVRADRDCVSVDLDNLVVDVEIFVHEANAGLALRASAQSGAAHERLEYAESLYAGDFLEEDPYEDWAVALREEARAAYAASTRALAEDAAAAGEHSAAASYLLRVLERDAYDEHAHLALVSALAAAGRHGDARRGYRRYAELMAEIGVEPASFPA